jgi:hypothetical protein
MTPTTDTFLNDIPRDLATRAHSGTSFVPETRADQERRSYAAQLVLDFDALSKYATTDEKRATLEVEFSRYRAGYAERYRVMLGAKARCMSTMITGGSNFPVRSQRKRSDAADKRTTDLLEYRERAIAAIRKALTPEFQPIMSGDSDATERLAEKIAKAEACQARMKAANTEIRKRRHGAGSPPVPELMALGFSESQALDLLKPDFTGRLGFPSYELTNNNANIRRMKARLAEVSKAQATETVEVNGESATFSDCPAEFRVRLFFPGKPAAEVRSRLKSGGFRWAPSLGCWQAYRNDRTIAMARREAGEPVCIECKGTGEVYTAGQVTVECEACVEPCAAEENGMPKCDDDHKARGVACGVCVPTTDEV